MPLSAKQMEYLALAVSGKKVKATTPAANGAKPKEVKSEPLADDGQGGEEEVGFF